MLAKTLLLGAIRLLVGAYPSWPMTPLPTKQSIYFSNHTSHLDTLVILSALTKIQGPAIRPVAARDYWGCGPIRRYIAESVLNSIMIDRYCAHGQDPLEPIRQALASGDSLILFPEGTRGDSATPAPFKSGLHSLAMEFPGVVLVPVYLENLNRIMPKGALLPVPLISHLYFGQPLSLGNDEDRTAFLSRARDAIIALPLEQLG